jgi:dolichol-phosphate mannosyltransferase
VRALVVLPTYNEVDNVGPLIEALLYHATEAEILVVDDSSPDGTATATD